MSPTTSIDRRTPGSQVCITTSPPLGIKASNGVVIATEKKLPSVLVDETSYFNQILTAVLEVSDDSDSSISELALLLIVEMLKNQKDCMEDSMEIVIEKLLHVTKDTVAKVANEAEHCLTILLSQYDPFRCLSVIVPLLVSEDEKTLVTCINCLTKAAVDGIFKYNVVATQGDSQHS